MKNKTVAAGLSLVLLLAWALPLYGITYNQLYPSYGSALGVAYGFILGCIVHFVLLLVWIGIRRSKLQRVEWTALLSSFCIMIVLTVLSDQGWLSRIVT